MNAQQELAKELDLPIVGLSDEEVQVIADAIVYYWSGGDWKEVEESFPNDPWLPGYQEYIEDASSYLGRITFVALRHLQVPRYACRNCGHDMYDHTQDEVSEGGIPEPVDFDMNPCDITLNPNEDGENNNPENYCPCKGFEIAETS